MCVGCSKKGRGGSPDIKKDTMTLRQFFCRGNLRTKELLNCPSPLSQNEAAVPSGQPSLDLDHPMGRLTDGNCGTELALKKHVSFEESIVEEPPDTPDAQHSDSINGAAAVPMIAAAHSNELDHGRPLQSAHNDDEKMRQMQQQLPRKPHMTPLKGSKAVSSNNLPTSANFWLTKYPLNEKFREKYSLVGELGNGGFGFVVGMYSFNNSCSLGPQP